VVEARVARREQEGVVTRLGEASRDGREHTSEEDQRQVAMAGVVADDDRHEASFLSGQRARGRIGAVTHLACYLADALTRRTADVALVVERAGHGRDRHACAFGNVLDRRSNGHEPHDTSTGISGGERCPKKYKVEFMCMRKGVSQ
jgi:hypothetical protein